MIDNPLSPYFKPSDSAMKLGQTGTLFALISLGISRYGIKIEQIPGGIQLPPNFLAPLSTVLAMAALYFLILYFIYYAEELYHFNQTDYEDTYKTAVSLISSSPPVVKDPKLAELVRAMQTNADNARRSRRRFGIARHTLILGIPIMVFLLIVYFEGSNILRIPFTNTESNVNVEPDPLK